MYFLVLLASGGGCPAAGPFARSGARWVPQTYTFSEVGGRRLRRGGQHDFFGAPAPSQINYASQPQTGPDFDGSLIKSSRP
jgi:hypothetical protein